MLDALHIAISSASDSSVIVYVDTKTLGIVKANAIVTVITSHLLENRPRWCVDYIPSYNSLMIQYSLFDVDHFEVNRFLRALIESLQCEIELIVSGDADNVAANPVIHQIPVCYDIMHLANDLPTIAKIKGIDQQELIRLHCSVRYRVFATGFLPGFAYLGELPEALSQARLQKPRLKVPKGAVAIADRQTAIYPEDSPGGWHILGYTPVALLSAEHQQGNNATQNIDALFKTGDYVEFYAISAEQYRHWGA